MNASPSILKKPESAIPSPGPDPSAANGRVNFYPDQLKPIRLHIPADFEASKYPTLQGKEHFANWFLNKIIRLQVCYKHSCREDYVNISQQTRRQFITYRHEKTVVETLLRHRVVECNRKYQPGVHSMGWRLGPKFRGKMKTVLLSDPCLINKMLAARIRWCEKALPLHELTQTHQHLHKWLSIVRIDQEKAKRLNREAVAADRVNYANENDAAAAVSGNDMVIDEIAGGEFDFTICPQGRIHTPVTRLFTSGRSCLSIEGKPLVSIDIANSQLIFFSLMLQESLHQKRALALEQITEAKEQKERSDNGFDVDEHLPISPIGAAPLVDTPELAAEAAPAVCSGPTFGSASFSPLVDTPEPAPEASADTTAAFIRMAYDGTIYDYLMVKLDELKADGSMIARGQFKPLFFKQVLYNDSSKQYARDYPLAKIFRKEFPEVWSFILDAKEWDGIKAKEKYTAWKQLSLKMQRRESTFMISHVCGRLQQHHAECPVVTVHDSIMTWPEFVPLVERVMREEFERLGVSPRLRIEGLPPASEPDVAKEGIAEAQTDSEGYVSRPEDAESVPEATESKDDTKQGATNHATNDVDQRPRTGPTAADIHAYLKTCGQGYEQEPD